MKRLNMILIVLAIFLAHSSFSFAQGQACDYKVEIILNSLEFEKDDFKWKIKATRIDGMPTNITATAEIKDLSGKTINLYKPWASEPISRQKTSNWQTANLNAGKEYKIIAKIGVKCNDTNKDNDIDTKIIKINTIENVICLREKQKSQGNVAYESSNERAKKLIVIFILMLSILLNIVLIWKR